MDSADSADSTDNTGGPAGPMGERIITVVAAPADTNPSGDIFGGWILSQMDIAAGVQAARIAEGRTATVGVKEIKFHKPVSVGDLVSCYVHLQRVGTTSMTFQIEAWVTNSFDHKKPIKVIPIKGVNPKNT